MKKRILSAILVTVLLLSSIVADAATVTMFAKDGRTTQVDSAKVDAYKKVGWYEGVTMYAKDGRTTLVSPFKVDAYKKVGWYEGVTMYAKDGRTTLVSPFKVDAYKKVGWYEGVTMYAKDGRTTLVSPFKVDAYKKVGWYEGVTMYAKDGRTTLVSPFKVDAYKKVGWYEGVTMYAKDGRTTLVSPFKVDAYKKVGWYEGVTMYAKDGRTTNSGNNNQNGASEKHITNYKYETDIDLSIKGNILTVSGITKAKEVIGITVSFPERNFGLYQEEIPAKINEKFQAKIDLSKRRVSYEDDIKMVVWINKGGSSAFCEEMLIYTDENRKNYSFEKPLSSSNVSGVTTVTKVSEDDKTTKADATKDVSVYIDGEKISFDVKPEIINGRTMVPMRKIFEYIGAKVIWDNDSRKIEAYCKTISVTMQIGNKKMLKNDDKIILDSPPIIKNSTTLVPLRAVAEAFSAQVEWNGDARIVNIKTPYPKNNNQNGTYSEKHISSPGYAVDLDLSIKDNILTVSGNIKDKDVTGLSINFPGRKEDYYQEDISAKVNEKFQAKIDLSKRKASDENTIEMVVWINKVGSSGPTVKMFINTDKNGKNYSFEKPEHWDNNKEFLSVWVNPIDYLNPTIDTELVTLSNNICKGATDDYDKVLKIHDWVADNIYYMNDPGFYPVEPMEIYKKKYTVCAGYTILAQALIQAQGIPCRCVGGNTGEEHAWNQAYVDNRWVTFDATGDSSNKYEHGEFIKGKSGVSHTFFDMSDYMLSSRYEIEFFSYGE